MEAGGLRQEQAEESFLRPEDEKQQKSAIVAAFAERLKKVAGFEYVREQMPMVNSKNADVYYLFFASQKPVAEKIINGIFKGHRR